MHSDYPGGGATGTLVKDYRGKNAEKEVWKFDAALVAQIKDTLKQAAIEGRAVDREARNDRDEHQCVAGGGCQTCAGSGGGGRTFEMTPIPEASASHAPG